MRYAAELVACAIGDDSGSRLYWDLVDTGTAESAELSFNDYDGSGLWMTYYGGLPDRTATCLSRIEAIYADVNRDGYPDVLASRRGQGIAVYLNPGIPGGTFAEAAARFGWC